MEFPITIFLIPVVVVVGLVLVGFYFACKPYWEEQERRKKPPTDSHTQH